MSYGVAESATASSAKLLFSRLGIAPKPTYEPLGDALTQLQAGQRDAVVVLGGNPRRRWPISARTDASTFSPFRGRRP